MGFKATSTRRSTATSAQSNQTATIYTGSGYAVAGATVTGNTSVSLGVVTPGSSSASSTVTVASGPTIGNIAYLDANNVVISGDIAVSTTGGNILITGSGFVANSSVYLNNSLVSNTFINSTQIRAVCPAASAGNVTLMIFTPTNVGTIRTNGVRYSGSPTWTTSAVSMQNNSAANVALIASSDSTLTYTLQAGSTLPTGISLNSAGYLAGTATGYTVNTSSTAVIIATDSEGQATQQTLNITITVADPQFPYTTLLLNGETSVTPFIADASTNNFALTVAGDAKATKFTPYSNGYYSNYFNGSTDYFTTPSNAALSFGTGDFTVELWMYVIGAGDTQFQNIVQTRDGTNNGFLLQYDRTNKLVSFVSDTSMSVASASSSILDSTWYHIAITRSGTSLKLFVNGAQAATQTTAENLTSTGPMYVSRRWVSDGALHYFNGHISNLRLIKGSAVYTAAFTPPTTPLTAVAGTSILTCQSNRFIDNSSNAFAVTLSGTPKVSPAIPFAANSSYATYGSAYIPSAVTNYLSVVHNAATTIVSGATDSFIAECWVYFNSVTATTAIMDQSGQNTVTFQNWSLNLDSAKKFQIIWGGTGSPGSQIGFISGTTVAVSGAWYHVAYVKTNADWSLFVNGVRESTFNGLNTANDGTQNPLRIGSDNFSSQSINGYIADVRIYKGASAGAPYSATSTTITIPTSPLTAVTNTQLLTCQYNGGANNYGIIDNGPFNNVITRVGNATQGSLSPYSPNGWSNYFNGSTDSLSLPISTNYQFGTSTDFTVECWFYLTTDAAADGGGNKSAQLFSCESATAGTSTGWLLNLGGDASITGTNVKFQQRTAGTISFVSSYTTTVTKNTWHHLAFCRSGTTTSLFYDGVRVDFQTGVSQTITSSNALLIGKLAITSYPQLWPGYISNIRVVKGTAVYDGATITVPTSPLTAIANTVLLTSQSNRFVDNSSVNNAITISGTPSVQAVGPFSPGVAYTPSSHGGGAYFDGTGDYLSLPFDTKYDITASDFTVEAWIYRTASAEQYIIHQRPPSTANGWAFEVYTGNVLRFYYTGGSTIVGTTTIPLNAWTHIAATRSGTAFKTFVNGVVDANTTIASGTAATGLLYVGTDNTPGATNFTGYLSDVRLIKGTALYTAAFTPPTAPLTSPTSTPSQLLLNFTNGGIVDAHSSMVFETVGNAQVSTSVKKYGSASMYFDGTGDYLQFPASSQTIAFGTGDFTVECWVNFAANNSTYNPFVRFDGTGTFDFGYDFSTTQLKYSGSAAIFAVTQSVTVGTWYHVAITRASGSSRLFVNGTQVGTTATGDTNNYAVGAFKVGGSSFSAAHVMNGYIDDLRITKGFARYTANFTPSASGFLGQ